MRKRHTAVLTVAIIATSAFGTGSLLAQEDPQQEPMEGKGMHGDMMQEGGMMGMMSDMNTMMEKCNAMMDKMQQGHETDSNA
ncbi:MULTISPECIES: hypothetical protein [Halomonadaceae]|jgi:hypothetical protein|uniref:Pentapeptide MXKDX repeat protein n=1 Tax=Halomonas litopenaei TaxID=2109328 RepID=A0ABX5J237_9GAMM|nr:MULTISPECIES: hypothetical protein [Halomonadaceae]KFF50349.1 hypothetical protein GY26_02305 [Gammaproteobacteria bacterium MFB021]MED5297016.1 hypothetical protein [Pseudomonadota bacterium]MBN8412698.1 hypothetical protein [Halomonas litopenaei]MBY5928796.1 hypothetical protein [Halomonas sp. DP8Y7-3]MBY5939299.1 hypothetical protein [Halomonas sp. DP5N14-9]|tara:strand:+ start:732 stop:977 length:246 start_codon:yes stop_codon:yes gene_type:complete